MKALTVSAPLASAIDALARSARAEDALALPLAGLSRQLAQACDFTAEQWPLLDALGRADGEESLALDIAAAARRARALLESHRAAAQARLQERRVNLPFSVFIPIPVLTVLMLVCSNVFMTFAWYGHLKYKSVALPVVILVSWGIALFEYCFQVPANRWAARSTARCSSRPSRRSSP